MTEDQRPAPDAPAMAAALRRLRAQAPADFHDLFDPAGPKRAVPLPAELAAPLLAAGLVEAPGALLPEGEPAAELTRPIPCRALLRIRSVEGPGGPRLYIMDAPGRSHYHQEVWPETDALLAVLDAEPPGRLRVLDVGTGCGLLAIEAAARGHQVVATDLWDDVLDLARRNAALNGLAHAVEMRRGHLLEPVRGEAFDLILAAPHYSRLAAQLRVELLRDAPPLLGPGGRLALGTVVEWEGARSDEAPLLGAVLQPLAAAGLIVEAAPILAAEKRGWFAGAWSAGPLPGLLSRQRFLITLRAPAEPPVPGDGALRVRPVPEAELPRRWHAPLAELRVDAARPAEVPAASSAPTLAPAADDAQTSPAPLPAARLGPLRSAALQVLDDGDALPTRWAEESRRGPVAVVASAEDLARLRELLAGMEAGLLTLSGPLPGALLDGCRWGAGTCVAPAGRGAAGAVLGPGGVVRPCTHGGPIGSTLDRMADLEARLRDAAEATAARRGCERCPAAARCSRCLFPHSLPEEGYCALVRAHSDVLPLLPRLFQTLAQLWRLLPPSEPGEPGPALGAVRLKLRPGAAPLLAAAPAAAQPWPGVEAQVAELRRRWREAAPWLALPEGRPPLLCSAAGVTPLRPEVAALGELIGDGADAGALREWLRQQGLPPRLGERALRELAAHL